MAAMGVACQDRPTTRRTGAVDHPIIRALLGWGAHDVAKVGRLRPKPGLVESGGKPRRLEAHRSSCQFEQVEDLERYVLLRYSLSEPRLDYGLEIAAQEVGLKAGTHQNVRSLHLRDGIARQ